MEIELNYEDLTKLAGTSTVVKEGVTIKINRPILTRFLTDIAKHEYSITFFLDDSDPRSEQWYFKPKS